MMENCFRNVLYKRKNAYNIIISPIYHNINQYYCRMMSVWVHIENMVARVWRVAFNSKRGVRFSDDQLKSIQSGHLVMHSVKSSSRSC